MPNKRMNDSSVDDANVVGRTEDDDNLFSDIETAVLSTDHAESEYPDPRIPRDSSSRDKEDFRPNDSWNPTSLLPAPNPHPDWVFRYIRVSNLSQNDSTNVSRSFREGWVPVRKEEVPEIALMSDIDSRFPDCLQIGGLLLCKMPVQQAMRRSQHYEKMANTQIESLDRTLFAQEDRRMPLLKPERTTRVSRSNFRDK